MWKELRTTSGVAMCCHEMYERLDVFQIEISKNYGNIEWREDLKIVLREAGTSDSPLVFLFSDTQIKRETMVEDINNILNSGEVPNLFPNDEKVAICELVRPFAKEVFGRAAQDMTQIALYSFFITRVRSNLHIVLAFSPIGDAFRDRLRKVRARRPLTCGRARATPSPPPLSFFYPLRARVTVTVPIACQLLRHRLVHGMARRCARGGGREIPCRCGVRVERAAQGARWNVPDVS